jgi:anti-sigma factor RsiW
MTARHLTDFEIQDYLDGNRSTSRSDIREHLNACKVCRQKVAEYQQLYSNLADDQNLVLPNDFADRVLAHVQPVSQAKRISKWWLALLVLGTLGLSIGITIYFTGSQKIISGLSNLSDIFLNMFSTLISSFKGLIALSGTSASLFILAAVVIGFVYLIDHFLLSDALKMHSNHS